MIVDLVAPAVTHLVVEPEHRHGRGRLVPAGLADATAGEIGLRCTLAEFGKLEPAEETQFRPGAPGCPGYDPDQVPCWAYHDLGGGAGMGGDMVSVSQTVTYDSVPVGEVEVRRGEHVHATDGEIGKVHGLVIDCRSHHVTRVLLQEGHVRGRKDVIIPISAVIGSRTVSASYHQAASAGPAAPGHRSPGRVDR